MPNPRAQRPLSLQSVTEDIRSLAQPAEAMLDMLAGAAKGSVSATAGAAGDLESLARGLASAYRAPSGQRMDAFSQGMSQPTVMPTTANVSAALPAVVPKTAPLSRQHTAEYGQTMGEFIPTPGSGAVIKGGLSAAKKVPRMAGEALNERLLSGQSLTPGFNTPAPINFVIKPERGNWLTGTPEKAVSALKSGTIAGETPAQRIPRHEELLRDQSLSAESRASLERHLNLERQRDALDKWVDSNLLNYVKKDMGSPSDTIRLTLDKRRDEIEAKFVKEQERAQKMADRANAEVDPRKKANLMRQSQQMMTEASFEKDLATSNMFPITESLRGYAPDVGTVNQRVLAGFPEQGMARNPEASAWESLADESIFPTKVKDYLETKKGYEKYLEAKDKYEAAMQEARNRMTEKWIDAGLSPKQAAASTSKMDIFDLDSSLGDTNLKDLTNEMNKYASNTNLIRAQHLKDNPWIEKLNPEEQIYKTSTGSLFNMNFDHVIDVLREDLTAGRISPEQLNKVSIDQAIRRTQEYDIENARKMIQAKIASREGMPVYKEYPEGFKWYELNRPGDFAAESQSMGHSVRGYEPPYGHPDWVEASGEMGNLGYGHGGWEAIKSGKAKVYSLVDPKGAPHVTVEVRQGRDKTGLITPEELPPEVLADIKRRNVHDPKFMWRFDEDLGRHVPEIGPFEPTITQIKGKGNAAPKEEYLPYVQDFVRGGKWSDVGDLHNTGLVDIRNLPDKYRKIPGIDDYLDYKATGRYHPTSDLDEMLYRAQDDGMKRGGRVHISNNPDTMHMELNERKFGIGGVVSGLAKAGTETVAKKVAEKAAEKVAEKQAVKASEALAPHINKKVLGVTEVDRSLTDPDAGMFGGIHFPRLQHESLPHADVGATWGTMSESAAGRILGAQKKHPKDSVLWTTRIGGPESHRGNEIVFGRMIEDFAKNLAAGRVTKEQIVKINKYLSNAVTEKGGPKVFANGFDITDPASLSAANTFDRRQLVSNVLAGNGVGGMKGRTVDYDRIIKETTEPSLFEAKTGMVGPRLFQLTGDIIHDPSLNPAFHKIMTGKDMDVEFNLAPGELMMPQLYKRFQETKGRPPGEYDFRRGHYPTEPITDQMVNRLAIEGFKKGGKASTNELIQVKKGRRHVTAK